MYPLKELKTPLSQLFVECHIDKSVSYDDSALDNKTNILLKLFKHVKVHNDAMDPIIFAKNTVNPECIVIMIASWIDNKTIEKFKTNLQYKVKNIPIFIQLLVPSLSINIKKMNSFVNMSISEPFLTLSNDVLVIVTSNTVSKVLMSKGCFNRFNMSYLSESTILDTLPGINIDTLQDIYVDNNIPDHIIKLRNVDEYVNLKNVYHTTDIPINIINGLCDRSCIPKLDLKVISHILQNMYENPELKNICDELYSIDTSTEFGVARYRVLTDLYLETKKKKKAIVNLINMISDYQKNNMLFTLSTGAPEEFKLDNLVQIFETKHNFLHSCVKIECPIMMDMGNACILIKYPDNKKFIEECTSDYSIQNPFEFGASLVNNITPGIFCQVFAESVIINPYTRDQINGYLPLSTDPEVVMYHMCKLFTGYRKMWHCVRSYIYMLSHMCEIELFRDEINIIKECICGLFWNYNTSIDLIWEGCAVSVLDQKSNHISYCVPLTIAFQNVLTNYSTCLQHRNVNDVLAIMQICKFAMPRFIFEENKIREMFSITMPAQIEEKKQYIDTIASPGIVTVVHNTQNIGKTSGVKRVIGQMQQGFVNLCTRFA